MCLANCTYSQTKLAKDNEIFIVCRSTKNKQNIIAKDFNLKDSLTTHIGLGIKTTESMLIYNVSNVKKSNNGSALLIEDLDGFLNVDDIKAYSIWSIKIDDKTKIEKLKDLIKKHLKSKIVFDYEFSLNNEENKLYCSEFVYNMLTLSGIIERTNPSVKVLNQLYSKALKKNELEYIPVDFFQIIEGFQLVNENYNNQENSKN